MDQSSVPHAFYQSYQTPTVSELLFPNTIKNSKRITDTSSQSDNNALQILSKIKEKWRQYYFGSMHTHLDDILLPLKKKPTEIYHSIFKSQPRDYTYVFRVQTRRTQPTPTPSSSPSTTETNDTIPTNSDPGIHDIPHSNTPASTTTLVPNPATNNIPVTPPPNIDTHISLPFTQPTPPPLQMTPISIADTQSDPRMHTTSDVLSKMIQRPQTFKGAGPLFRRRFTQTWIERMELWLNCLNVAEYQKCDIAMTYLQPPAYTIMAAQKKILEKSHKWTNTYEQFKQILLKHFGEIDPDFNITKALFNLTCNHENDLLKYTKSFQDLCSKLLDEPLSDQASISLFFNGIKNRGLTQDLLIDPQTGLKWNDVTKLHNYILTKYGLTSPSTSRFDSRPKYNTGNYPYPSNPQTFRPNPSWTMNRSNRSFPTRPYLKRPYNGNSNYPSSSQPRRFNKNNNFNNNNPQSKFGNNRTFRPHSQAPHRNYTQNNSQLSALIHRPRVPNTVNHRNNRLGPQRRPLKLSYANRAPIKHNHK